MSATLGLLALDRAPATVACFEAAARLAPARWVEADEADWDLALGAAGSAAAAAAAAVGVPCVDPGQADAPARVEALLTDLLSPPPDRPPRLGLAVARFGEGVGGGAEANCRALARWAAEQGWGVEVLTTTARQLDDDADAFPAGVSEARGVRVERLAIDPARRDATLAATHRANSDPRQLSPQALADWAAAGVVGDAYEGALRRLAERVDAIYVHPYLPFALTSRALESDAVRARLLIQPALHDEPMARTPPIRRLLNGAAALIFACEAELALARRLGVRHPRSRVIGHPAPLQPTLPPSAEALARVDGDPRLADGFVLYCGRLEHGKGLPELLAAHAALRADDPQAPPLVVCGAGPLAGAPAGAGAIELGFVPADDKRALMTRALALANPSRLESFSHVLMESWLAGRPVIVDRRCGPTADHVARARGGLRYGDAAHYARCVRALAAAPEWAATLGDRGAAYVRRRYAPERFYARFGQAVEALRVCPRYELAALDTWRASQPQREPLACR